MPTKVLSDNILYGGDELKSECDKYQSIAQYALERFKHFGDKKILFDGTTKEEITANQLHDLVVKCALGLQKLGVGEGDAVAICSENSIEFIVSIFGILCVNGKVAPLNLTYTERELVHALKLSEPKIVLTSAAGIDTMLRVRKSCGFIENIILFSEFSPLQDVILWKNFMNLFSNEKEFVPKACNDNQTSLILCSSGTTGQPKGVEITHKSLKYVTARAVPDIEKIPLSSLTVIPFVHAYGLFVAIFHPCSGTPITFLRRFNENIYLKSIQDYKIRLLYTVPYLLVFLSKSPLVDKYDLSSLLVFVCGTSPLSKEVIAAVKNRLGQHIRIQQAYGLSEATLSLTSENVMRPAKPGGVGRILRGVYAKVVDENGKALGAFQHGELCFKSPSIMKGYSGNTEATAVAIDQEGWLHTGDVGYYDNEFDFFIVDRIKELIKYKGFQVPPAELEALLLAHPKIKDAAVTGKPDEICGELPTAFVVKQPGVELNEQEVFDYIANQVSTAKRLRGGVRFVKEIPKSETGKILRRILKEILANDSIVKAKL